MVGAGVMGTAAGRSLARRGLRVLLLDRFGVGNDRGSSHGLSRIFRFSYADRRYVRMAMDSLPLWRELEREAGGPLLTATGGLDLGPPATAHADALQAEGAPFEWLGPEEVRERFGLRVSGDALFQPDAGTLDADRVWRAQADLAVSAGAELREFVRAVGITTGDGEVRVQSADGDQVASRSVVVTAGAWARPLLATAGIELPARVTRETVAYFQVPDPSRMPAVVEWDTAVYALRTGDVIKAAEHHRGPEANPEAEGPPDRASIERVGAWLRDRVPGADGEPLRLETCLYTNTPDEGFVVERHGRVVVGSPCSGHGFKFAPLIGERLADLAAEVV